MRNRFRSFESATAAATVREIGTSRSSMRFHRDHRWAVLVCVCILPLSSCFVRKRVVTPPGYRLRCHLVPKLLLDQVGEPAETFPSGV
jgi:hypothetical protein